MLSKESKIEIIESRINIIEGVLYNLGLAIFEEESKSQPATDYLNELNREKNENTLSLLAMTNKLQVVLSE
jgi:hypothetical protein